MTFQSIYNTAPISTIKTSVAQQIKNSINSIHDKLFSKKTSSRPLPPATPVYDTSFEKLQSNMLDLPPLKSDFSVTMVGAEYAGLYKVGGLGEALEGLSRGIKEEHPGATVKLIYPKFKDLDEKILNQLKDVNPKEHTDSKGKKYLVYSLKTHGVQCYFIEDPSFELLPAESGKKQTIYDKNEGFRFATFSHLAADLIHTQGTDIIHLHDWHVSGIALALQKHYPDEWTKGALPPVVFTFHNNMRSAQGRLLTGEGGTAATDAFIDAGITSTNDNLFVRILDTADMVTTVSEQFGKEAQQEQYGEGVGFSVREAAKQGKLIGIVNGVTPGNWDPETNQVLKNWKDIETKHPVDLSYSSKDDITSKKQMSKEQLQKWVNLYLEKDKIDCSKPIVTFVGRFSSYQKGIDKFKECIEAALKEGAQFICMGTDEDDVSKSILDSLEKKYKQGVLFLRDYRQEDAQNKGKLFYQQGILNQRPGIGPIVRAASDFCYIPSSFEPCGLVQFEGWMFGSLAIGSTTGGLADTIIEDKQSKNFNGFLFERQNNPRKSAFVVVQEAVRYWKKLSIKEKNAHLKLVMENAKHASWATPLDAPATISPVKRYIEVYKHAIHRKFLRANSKENVAAAAVFDQTVTQLLSKEEKYLSAVYHEKCSSAQLLKLYNGLHPGDQRQTPLPYGQNVNFTTHEQFGAFLTDSGTHFSTLAPQAHTVSLILLNEDESIFTECPLIKTASEKWELNVPHIKKGQSYQFRVDGTIVSDLYARSSTPSKTNPSNPFISLVTANSHQWNDTSWVTKRPSAAKLSYLPINIQELHPALWKKKEGKPLNYRELAIDLAKHCTELNYTHVELMGILEHPYAESWGYQVSGYFSPSHRMGTPDDFKFLVDHLHQNGIGVILDWVPAHFAKGDFGLSPTLEAKGVKYNLSTRKHFFGYGSNHFDFSKKEVREFLISSAYFWLKEMHVDGLRVDCVRSLLSTEDSQSANLFLKDLNQVIHSNCPGAFTIAEEFSGNTEVTRPLHENGYQFDLRWDTAWHGITIQDYFSLPFHEREEHYDVLKGVLQSDKHSPNIAQLLFVGHDQVQKTQKPLFLKTPGISNIDEQYRNLKTLLSFMICFPGKKLNFMGNELGSSIEWDTLFNETTGLVDSISMEDPYRKQLLKMQMELHHIYRTKPAFHESDNKSKSFTWIDDPAKVVHAFRRHGSDGSTFTSFHNFSQQEETMTITVPKGGTQVIFPKEIFNSNHTEFGEHATTSGLVSTYETPTYINYSVKVPPLTSIIVEECTASSILHFSITNLTEDRKVPLLKHTKKVAIAAFKTIGRMTVFPLRYIGSKSWSIPGVIARTPCSLLRKIFRKNTSFTKEVFGSIGYQSNFEKELSPEESAHFLPYCAITAFTHNSKPEWLQPFGFKAIAPRTLASLINHTSLKMYAQCFLDPESGLKVTLSEKGDELVIGIGALKSFETEIKSNKKKSRLYNKQLITGGHNFIGLKPAIYKQADAFITSLLKLDAFKDKKVMLVGTCYGGSIASYVAIKQRLLAHCFNTFPLGAGLQEALPKRNLKDAEQLVSHLSVYDDFASDPVLLKFPSRVLSSLGIRTPGNFGKRFVIPTPYKSSKERHAYILGGIMHHQGYDKETKPHEIGANHPLINYLREHQQFDMLPQNVQWQLKFATDAKYIDHQLILGKLFNLDGLKANEVELLQRALETYSRNHQSESIYPHLLDYIERYKVNGREEPNIIFPEDTRDSIPLLPMRNSGKKYATFSTILPILSLDTNSSDHFLRF